jgi:RNA polymerase sigma factor CnrH
LLPPASDTDAALAAQALAGRDASFAQLMSRHKHWVFGFIRRYVGNSPDAYDVLQETFFSAWLALAHYQIDRPFDVWLRRIALNKCRDRWRRELVRRTISGLFTGEETPDVPDPAPGPAAVVATDQELQQLQVHLQRLPRGLMEPLLLTTLEGLSHKEAGELLGLNAKAVEMRVYRARARLEALYGQKRPNKNYDSGEQ